MSLNDLIFIENLPKLDIHGLDAKSAVLYINDFIFESYWCQKEYVVIVHGIGLGVLQKEVSEQLMKHKLVLAYKLWSQNVGCTVVWLKKNKKK